MWCYKSSSGPIALITLKGYGIDVIKSHVMFWVNKIILIVSIKYHMKLSLGPFSSWKVIIYKRKLDSHRLQASSEQILSITFLFKIFVREKSVRRETLKLLSKLWRNCWKSLTYQMTRKWFLTFVWKFM